jgi:hypothetical protein
MTGTRPATPARASVRAQPKPAPVLRPSVAGLRDRSRRSRDRDSCQQIQSHAADSAIARSMIRAMHGLSYHLPAACTRDTRRYTSACRSSYSVVYTTLKEVS